MCNYHIDWTHIAEDLAVSVADVKGAINYDVERLQEMERDGILCLTENTLEMTGEGNPFVRTVAAVLDPMMVATDKKFQSRYKSFMLPFRWVEKLGRGESI